LIWQIIILLLNDDNLFENNIFELNKIFSYILFFTIIKKKVYLISNYKMENKIDYYTRYLFNNKKITRISGSKINLIKNLRYCKYQKSYNI